MDNTNSNYGQTDEHQNNSLQQQNNNTNQQGFPNFNENSLNSYRKKIHLQNQIINQNEYQQHKQQQQMNLQNSALHKSQTADFMHSQLHNNNNTNVNNNNTLILQNMNSQNKDKNLNINVNVTHRGSFMGSFLDISKNKLGNKQYTFPQQNLLQHQQSNQNLNISNNNDQQHQSVMHHKLSGNIRVMSKNMDNNNNINNNNNHSSNKNIQQQNENNNNNNSMDDVDEFPKQNNDITNQTQNNNNGISQKFSQQNIPLLSNGASNSKLQQTDKNQQQQQQQQQYIDQQILQNPLNYKNISQNEISNIYGEQNNYIELEDNFSRNISHNQEQKDLRQQYVSPSHINNNNDDDNQQQQQQLENQSSFYSNGGGEISLYSDQFLNKFAHHHEAPQLYSQSSKPIPIQTALMGQDHNIANNPNILTPQLFSTKNQNLGNNEDNDRMFYSHYHSATKNNNNKKQSQNNLNPKNFHSERKTLKNQFQQQMPQKNNKYGSGKDLYKGVNKNLIESIDPKLREAIFYKVNGIQSKIQYEEWGNISYYERLCKKSEILKDSFKSQRESLKHMKESKQKFKEKYIQQQEQIKQQKDKIQKIQHTEKKKIFENQISNDIEILKQKIDEMKDLQSESIKLMYIYQIEDDVQNGDYDNNNKEEQQDKMENYDFEKESNEVINSLDKYIQSLQDSLTEFRKYEKLDKEGEEFNIRAQKLLQVQKYCVQFSGTNEKKLIIFNQQMGYYLKDMYEQIQKQVEFHERVQISIKLSSDIVYKIIWIRGTKIKELQKQIQQIRDGFKNLSSQNIFILNEKQKMFDFFNDSKKTLNKILDNISLYKKEIKNIGRDAISQYFLQIRMKQSIKVLNYLKNLKAEIQSIFNFEEFYRKEFILISDQIEKLSCDTKNIVQKVKDLKEYFDEDYEKPPQHFLSQKKQKFEQLKIKQQIFKQYFFESQKILLQMKTVQKQLEKRKQLQNFEYCFSKALDKMIGQLSKEIESLQDSMNNKIILSLKTDIYTELKRQYYDRKDELNKFIDNSLYCVKLFSSQLSEIPSSKELNEWYVFCKQILEQFQPGTSDQTFQEIKQKKSKLIQISKNSEVIARFQQCISCIWYEKLKSFDICKTKYELYVLDLDTIVKEIVKSTKIIEEFQKKDLSNINIYANRLVSSALEDMNNVLKIFHIFHTDLKNLYEMAQDSKYSQQNKDNTDQVLKVWLNIKPQIETLVQSVKIPFFFSKYTIHESIIIQAQSNEKTISVYNVKDKNLKLLQKKMAFMQPNLKLKQFKEFRFKYLIESMKENKTVGIGLFVRKQMKCEDMQFKENQPGTGYGAGGYLVQGDGIVYSHHDKQTNSKQNKSNFYFNQGDTVWVRISTTQPSKIEFWNETQDLSLKLPIVIKDKYIYSIGAYLHHPEDIITLEPEYIPQIVRIQRFFKKQINNFEACIIPADKLKEIHEQEKQEQKDRLDQSSYPAFNDNNINNTQIQNESQMQLSDYKSDSRVYQFNRVDTSFNNQNNTASGKKLYQSSFISGAQQNKSFVSDFVWENNNNNNNNGSNQNLNNQSPQGKNLQQDSNNNINNEQRENNIINIKSIENDYDSNSEIQSNIINMDGDFNNNEEEEYIDQQTYKLESEKKKNYNSVKMNRLTLDLRSQKHFASNTEVQDQFSDRKSENPIKFNNSLDQQQCQQEENVMNSNEIIMANNNIQEDRQSIYFNKNSKSIKSLKHF